MSWLFSQALVEGYSAASSLAGAPSARLNATPTQPAFLWRDKTTDAWSRFPSGMTCELLTDDRGEGLLTSYLAGFHARISPQPDEGQESTANEVDCSAKWPASLARYDPSSRSWKTRQCLLAGGLEEYSETWPSWGMTVDGECWERTPLALDISATAFGLPPLWPTPITNPQKNSDNAGGSGGRKWAKQNGTHVKYSVIHPNFYESLMGWPINWTNLKPLATDRFQQWLRSHGKF